MSRSSTAAAAAAVAAVAVVLLVALAGACGGDPGPDAAADERAAREVAARVVDGMFLGGDPGAACAAMTPAARAGAAGQVPTQVIDLEPTCADGLTFIAAFFGGLTGDDVRVTVRDVRIAGDSGEATLEYAGALRERFGGTTGRLPLQRVDGGWLVGEADAAGTGGPRG
jgi:hypothetical protein